MFLKPLAKSILIPLALAAAASAADAEIHNKILGSEITTLINPNEEMDDIMTIIKCLKDSGLLIKVVSKTFKNETKE